MHKIAICMGLWALCACRAPQPEPLPALEARAAEIAKITPDVAALSRVLDDPSRVDSARIAAAYQLQTVAPETLAAHWGRGDNPRIIRSLIEAQLAAKDEGALPLLLALFERVEGEGRIDFERDILHYGRRAEGRMLQLLHADSRSLVMRAMDALAKMGSVAAGDSIARLLQHPEPWLRISAAHAVGEIGAALAASDNKHVRKHAAIALGELGDRRGLEIVARMASDDSDSGVRFMAGRARDKLEQAP
ncbi:HEAT repeat domain-containing protein [bacterium]|nr:HEAT repeat domain-containing protein [bacterium]